MSPWWNKFFTQPCDVLITSEEIVFSQRAKVLATAEVPLGAADETFEARIRRTLELVTTGVPQNTDRRINIWLSHSLVQYGVLGIDARAMNAPDILTVLKAYWEDALDVPAASLEITYQLQPHGRSLFSSCCNSALVEAIKGAFAGGRWKIKHIAPDLAKTWNESRRQIRDDDYYLLIHQDKVLSIGLHEDRQWTAWTSEGCESVDWAELSNRTIRFSRHTGLSDCQSIPVWIYAPKATVSPHSAGLTNWSLLNDVTPRLDAQF